MPAGPDSLASMPTPTFPGAAFSFQAARGGRRRPNGLDGVSANQDREHLVRSVSAVASMLPPDLSVAPAQPKSKNVHGGLTQITHNKEPPATLCLTAIPLIH
ncbi:MAG: hypothetical protein JWQ24_4894 [Tardiphaga sp.]|nr:hypothetical protein [Tardiphaga sp.]